MTRTSAQLILALLLVLTLGAAVPAAGQTFTDTLIMSTSDFFLFDSDAGGQYEVTVTWDDPASRAALLILCDGDDQPLGISTGERDRTLRLSVGIPGSRTCAIGLGLIIGALTDYTLNFQSTDSATVSKRHARIRVLEGNHVLEDLGSKNGTKVNGNRIEKLVTLKDGSELTFGDMRFEFRLKK